MKWFAVVFPLLSGALFGVSGAFVRTLTDFGMDNRTILSTRALLAVALLGVGLAICNRSLLKIRPRDFWIFAASGLFGMLGLNLCYNEAINGLTLSLAAVLLSLSPVFVIFLAAVFFGEKITRRKLGCVGLALVGCVLVSGVLEQATSMRWSSLGIVFGVLSGLFYALYSIFAKVATKRGYPALTITFYSLLVYALALLPFTDWNMVSMFVQAAPAWNTSFLLINAACTSVLPYIFYNLGFYYLEAGKASILAGGSETVAAMLTGLVLYLEVPTVLSLLGIALTVAALGLLCRPDTPKLDV